MRLRLFFLIRVFHYRIKYFSFINFFKVLKVRTLKSGFIRYLNFYKKFKFSFASHFGLRQYFFFNVLKNYFSSGLSFFLRGLKKKRFVWFYVFETKRNIFLGARTISSSRLLTQLTAFAVSKKISSKKRKLQLLKNSALMTEILRNRLRSNFDLRNFNFGLVIRNFNSSRIQTIMRLLESDFRESLKFCIAETKAIHGQLLKVTKKRRRKYRGKFLQMA